MHELFDKIIHLINKEKISNIRELAQVLELNEHEVRGLLEMMIIQGALLAVNNEEVLRLKKPMKNKETYEEREELHLVRLLAISDTHLSSKYDRTDILEYLYDKAEERGVKYVLHAGDFTDGKSHRPDHQYELKELSYQGQVDYAVKKFPKREGIKTFTIAGNHDQWWYKSAGSDIVKSIAAQRDDIIYLGPDTGSMKIGKLKIMMFHGQGAPSYAVSYKLQRYVNHIPKAEQPHIFLTGHIHRSFYMHLDGTHCFQTAALIDQTPFARSMGMGNEKSCWWIDVYLDDRGIPVKVEPTLEIFNEKKIVKRK